MNAYCCEVPVLDHAALRARIRELIELEILPRHAPMRMWGGPGLGRVCYACQQTIRPEETELELQFEGRERTIELRLHQFCHAAWEVERHIK